MKIELYKKPKNVTIIEGFPGFGLVGTITTEFLIDHLKAEKIGRVFFHDLAPLIAVHEGKVVEPIGIFYDPKSNIVILHALANVKGKEWVIANALTDLGKQLSAKEIISVEGVGGVGTKGGNAFYYSKNKAWSKTGIEELKEGIVIGVTAAMLAGCDKNSKISCVFAETKSNLPDSRAAAKVIEVLDKYLGLNVDYKPLLKKADAFEGKIKNLISKGNKTIAQGSAKKETMNYFG